MPLKHVSQFRVRHYESDAYEHANYCSYLRYMQEAAFEATEAAGWTVPRMQTMGYYWLVRESRIDIHRGLAYADVFDITTYLAFFRKIGTRRCYEFRRQGDADPIATAYTDWVLVNAATDQPARIPDEVVESFMPEGRIDAPNGREKFPRHAMPGSMYIATYRVRWPEIDPVGHLNNSEYLAYAEDCSVLSWQDLGWPVSHMRESGFAVAARSHHVEYVQPALFGDTVEISTWVYEAEAGEFGQHYVFQRPADGAVLARVDSRWACLATDTWLPADPPAAFSEALDSLRGC